MTDDDRIFLEKNRAYMGATLKGEVAAGLLEALTYVPVCAACPAARWYKVTEKAGAGRVECFCVEFRGTMYSVKQEAVTACDARADAIDRLTPTKPSPG